MRTILLRSMMLVLLAASGCSTPSKESSARSEAPAVAAASSGEAMSDILLTASEEAALRDQIERNWNLGSLAGAPDLEDVVVKLRLRLQPDGTVTSVEVLDSQPNALFRRAAESAMRAVMISSPLDLAGKSYDYLILVFHPGEVVE